MINGNKQDNMKCVIDMIDCASVQVNIMPWSGKMSENTSQIVALAGVGMPLRKSLNEAVKWYAEKIESVD